MTSSQSKTKKFPCPGCGASLEFDPNAAQLSCPYCGREEIIPQSPDQVQERSYDEYFNANRTKLAALSSTAVEVACSDCGANITFEPPDVAGDCPFCAAHIVAQPKLADPTLAPEGVLPFSVGRKEARVQVKQWIASRWFAPNALKQLAQQEKLEGIYLPFWTYDCHTASTYRGERGTHYYVTETYTDTDDQGRSVTKTRQVQRTRWHPASGMVRRFFDDVLVAATTLIASNRLDALGPWKDASALQPYNPSFLAGFKAQRYQIPLKEGFEIAKGKMESTIYSDVRRDIGGDEQRVHHVATTYSAITFKHILMPIWMSSYRYHNKQYQVTINGCTGEVQGDRPYSVCKIALAVLAGLIVAGIIIFFIAAS